jgi:hypothetical protein
MASTRIRRLLTSRLRRRLSVSRRVFSRSEASITYRDREQAVPLAFRMKMRKEMEGKDEETDR